MHRISVGIGSNLGDRQSNILSALQRLRARANVLTVSAFYESDATQGAQGPAFLNVAAVLETSLDAQGFERFAHHVQTSVGRTAMQRLSARPIDIDVLVVDGRVVKADLAARGFNVVPLA
ncbi:MAG: 2-amino-4-hydroxy-6-hydroxymethyldihydropteridine diphosphokinase, partial [Candidatus Eremiobacteraeota bacterium]|nr:2-amino-4-hydroxy-6-hydroxymethyldihydropteridine diphosphokinase [Candidatus Eremiobacteraeota bacterium]